MTNIKTRNVSFSSVLNSEVWPSLKSAVTFRVVYWGQLFILGVADMEAWIWSRPGTRTHTHTHPSCLRLFLVWHRDWHLICQFCGALAYILGSKQTNIPKGRDRLTQGKNRQLGRRGGDLSEPDVLCLDVQASQMPLHLRNTDIGLAFIFIF